MAPTAVRPPAGAWEEHAIRSLADGVGANAWARRAQLVMAAWRGDSVASIASDAGLTPHTVKRWLTMFDEQGVPGLMAQPGSGRRSRVSDGDRDRIVAVARKGRWTLESLTEAVRAEGIDLGAGQLRRILIAAGVNWR
ncbi:helix-turn-helix domain-containing protein [Kutzneria sp. CA-103260]|uniref:helix-turn-helix domain-containing protein n=1 Tax=Kutzneria sp. CA-103260 TaxID=2802641 RepID=UPI001BA54C65|nr:helix-turn-helix domain-containing protein [Kutzneria sp. CA-103260]QUQ66971.1 Homeodomain-like domain protein [Kutzneria sp. CA-103260]